MGKLEGRTALVTGGSRGIGRAIAERFAQEGANVAVNFTSNESAAGEVVAFAEAQGVKTQMYKTNVGDEGQCQQMIERAIADFGQVDVLINNAGLGSAAIDRPTIADATNEQWSKLLGVNLWGPIYLCRALVPHMRKADRSDIVMISSIASQALNPGFGVYSVRQGRTRGHGPHAGKGGKAPRHARKHDRARTGGHGYGKADCRGHGTRFGHPCSRRQYAVRIRLYSPGYRGHGGAPLLGRRPLHHESADHDHGRLIGHPGAGEARHPEGGRPLARAPPVTLPLELIGA